MEKWEFKCGLCSCPPGELSSCINTVMPFNKLKGFLSLNQSINQSNLCLCCYIRQNPALCLAPPGDSGVDASTQFSIVNMINIRNGVGLYFFIIEMTRSKK